MYQWCKPTLGALAMALATIPTLGAAEETIVSHGISYYGELKYPADYPHFDYVNPDAPKGGTITLPPTTGSSTFDSFNNFILKGTRATQLGIMYDAMLVPNLDEPDSAYAYLAESIEYAKDRSWITFKMRKDGRFSDGEPITAHDAVFTYNILMEKGHPIYKASVFKDFEKVEALDDYTVKYTFKEGVTKRDLPITAGSLAILPEHYWKDRDFSESNLDVPVTSGAWTITDYEQGVFIKYCQVDDYWAKDHPANVGQGNFDCIKYEYFKDGEVSFEAFKSGAYLFRQENRAKRWKTEYDFPAIENAFVKTQELENGNVEGVSGIWLNLRKDKFKDINTRRALQYLFNFEWTNKTVFYDSYSRTSSFWQNSPMEASGKITPEELELLEPFRDQLIPEVFDEPTFTPPVLNTQKFDRKALRTAIKLLEEAGWVLKNGKLENGNGEKLSIEFVDDGDDSLHILTPIIDTMKRAGIDAYFTQIDRPQLAERRKNYDYDVLLQGYVGVLTPTENLTSQLFGSNGVEQTGTANLSGFSNPAVDELVKKIGMAESREELNLTIRAIDRVLRAYHIRIPTWHLAADRIAYWDVFDRPKTAPKYDIGVLSTWWFDNEKYDALKAKGALK